MTKHENTQAERFLESMATKYNFSWMLDPKGIERLTQSELGRGKKLVKTALFHIRQGLKSGSIWTSSYENYMLVSFFAGPEHVAELLNLQGFEAFWSQNDRSQRGRIMDALERTVQTADIGKLEEFRQRLEKIEYESGTDCNRYDKHDFDRVLNAAKGSHVFIDIQKDFLRA